jgi:N-acetylneuraminate synthase
VSVKPFSLRGRDYGYLSPYLIAEIGVNHEGSIERAKRLIESAAEAGAHAAKFQTYKADRLAARGLSPAYWDLTEEPSESQFDLFRRWDTFEPEDYRSLAKHCEACGIDFISTPFDHVAVDFLAPIMPAIKVASADVTNIPLLRAVGARQLPVIISTGASRLDEVAIALQELQNAGAPSIALLHCVLNYPTPPADAQLVQITELARVFGADHAIGYSDHVKPDPDGGMPALEMAALMGAVVIEKHFTDDKTGTGNDHYHAMDASDLATFSARLARLRELYGSRNRDLSNQAQAIANARRRIVATCDIAAGQPIHPTSLIALRASRGIEISHWDSVIGRAATRSVQGGAPIEWADLQ